MSGSSIPVYSASDIERDIKIGELYHRERFTVIQDGPIARVIQFVNPSGTWVQGCIKMNTNISDWSKYASSELHQNMLLNRCTSRYV